VDKISPIPGRDERLAIQIHSQHVASSKVAERESGAPAYKAVPRRIVAFLLDCAILAVLGLGLAKTLGPKLTFLDERFWWVGMVVAAIYFGFFDSEVSFGTTLGKRTMDIEVQRLDGESPKIIDAFLRLVPFVLAFAAFKISRLSDSHDPLILFFELIGVVAALSVIAITPLHPAHRGGHDLLMGTVVLRRKGERKIPPHSAKVAYTAFAVLAILAVALQGARAWHMMTDERLRSDAELVGLISGSMPKLRGLRLDGHGKTLKASAYVDAGTPEKRMQVQAKRIASKLAGSNSLPDDVSLIAVEIKTGFDIGLWRSVSIRTFKFPLYGERIKSIKDPNETKVRYKYMRKR